LKKHYSKAITLGIDAVNIRGGGGLTHLGQMLHAATQQQHNVDRIYVWGSEATLNLLPNTDWIEKVYLPVFDQSLLRRTLWQQRSLTTLLDKTSCDVLFAPGGITPYDLRLPSVVMSQNILPFDTPELQRFGLNDFTRYRLSFIAKAQIYSFKQAAGIIFLSQYARESIMPMIGQLKDTVIIPHGIEERFFCQPRPVRKLAEFTDENPCRILYVSIIDYYKHQWHVATAISNLRKKGIPLEIDFIGPANPRALKYYEAVCAKNDNKGEFLHYQGPRDFSDVHNAYKKADVFVFASSCENLPIILLEAMAAGLPIACSDRGPMPEILGEAGVYFDPEAPLQIEKAMQGLLEDDGLREKLAIDAYTKARNYSWDCCASDTFAFIASCLNEIER